MQQYRRREFIIAQDYEKPIYGDFKLWGKWEYRMGLPDNKIWNYPIGNGSTLIDTGGWLWLSAKDSDYSGIRLFNSPTRKALIDVTINVEKIIGGNGIRICAGSGNDNNTGNQVTINGGYLNVLKTSDALNKITKTSIFNLHEWYRICVGIDMDKNDNRIYLNDTLIYTVPNESLNTSYSKNTWILAQQGQIHIKKMLIFGA